MCVLAVCIQQQQRRLVTLPPPRTRNPHHAQIPTGDMTRLLSTPYGAEVTGTVFVTLNGATYIFNALQHPYGDTSYLPIVNATGACQPGRTDVCAASHRTHEQYAQCATCVTRRDVLVYFGTPSAPTRLLVETGVSSYYCSSQSSLVTAATWVTSGR